MARLLLGSVGFTALLSGVCFPVCAEEAQTQALVKATPGLDEIVVTAERREASIQKTPLSISAIGGNDLKSKQITDVEGLANVVPGITFGRNAGSAKTFIRGIGLDSISAGGDSRVAIYTDGVYNARSEAAFVGQYDLKRIEVLEGPQGTLYGRNSTAGAINIITADPTDLLDGFVSLTAGNYSTINTEGAVGGPIAHGVSARLAFQTADHGGYGKDIETGNPIDDEKTRAVRGKIRFDLASNLNLLLSADYYRKNDHSGDFHYVADTPGNLAIALTQGLGYQKASNPYDVAGTDPYTRLTSYGSSATINLNLGGAKITSISAYRRVKLNNRISSDMTTADYATTHFRTRSRQYTQELRVAWKLGPVDILAGGYYFNETNYAAYHSWLSTGLFGSPVPNIPLNGNLSGGNQRTNALAAFTQETLHVTDKLGLDFGLRYSHEKRRMTNFTMLDFVDPFEESGLFKPIPALTSTLNQSVSYNSTTPKVTAHYQFTNSIFGYATFSKGFQSGGFNFGVLQPPFKPERLTNYEVGIKSDLFDKKLRINLSGFYYDYSNVQVNITEGIEAVTNNAGKARMYGLEAQVVAVPTPDLNLNLGVAAIHARYKQYVTDNPLYPGQGTPGVFLNGAPAFDLSGNQMPYVPKLKISGGVAYDIHTSFGTISPRLDALWVDRIWFNQFEEVWNSQPPRFELNLYADVVLDKPKVKITAFMKNATNKYYLVAGTVSAGLLGYPVSAQIGAPRTFGVMVTKQF